MNQAQLMKIGISAALIYGAYRFAPNPTVKAMVLGVAGVAIAKNVPVVNQYVPV